MSNDEMRERKRRLKLEQIERRLSDLEKRMAGVTPEGEPTRIGGDRYDLLYADAPFGYQSLDADGRILSVNAEWCEIFCYSAAGAIGRLFEDFLPPEARDDFRDRFAHFKREGRVRDNEFDVMCADSSLKTIAFSGRCEYDDSGHVIRIHGFAQDVTARKTADRSLRQSEERFRALCESAPLGIFLTDTQGRILYVNKRLQAISGHSGEESMSCLWNRIVHPEDCERLLRVWRQNDCDGTEHLSTCRIITSAGELKWISVHAIPMIADTGKQIGRIGTIEDITVQRANERDLQESEVRYRRLFETVSDAIIVFDAETRRFIDANAAASSMYGYTRNEFLGMQYADITKENEQSGQSIENSLPGVREFGHLRYHRRKSGDVFPVEISTATFEIKNRRVLVSIIRDISQRIATGRSVRASERRFRGIFERSVIGMALVDRSGSFLVVNDSYCSILGYSQSEILSKRFADIVHMDDLPLFEGKLEEINSGSREYFQGEMRCLYRDGRTIWGIASITAVRSVDGEDWQYIIQYRDIAEEKTAREAISEREEKYRLVTENIPVVVYTALPDTFTTTSFVTSGIKELTGYCAKSIMEKPELYHQIIHEEDRERIMKMVSELVERKRAVFDAEYRIRTRSGEIKWLRDRARPRTDENGEIIRFDGFIEDITEKKRIEASLSESDQKYRTIVNGEAVGVSVIDRQMRVVSINKKMAEWFPDVDPSAKPLCYEVFKHPPGSAICSYCPTHKAMEDGRIHEAVSKTPTRGGIRNFRIISNPLRDARGEIVGVIETIEDISEKLKEEAETLRSEKLRSISILAGGIAHDFNNILASLLGNVSLIKDRVKDDKDLSELVAEIEIASDRAKRLTQQLDLFSKGKAPLLKAVNIGDVVRESVEFTLHGSSASCEYELPDDLGHVDIDADQIDQVINNIVLNAVQAMPDGGRINIQGKNIALDENNLMHLPEGEYISISVEDSGIGIPEDDLPLVLEPFFTTKREGSGLGLAHCATIIDKHHGALRVESTVGVGTTVHIYLPASSGEHPQRKRKKAMPMQGCRVLVLDDEEALRKLLKRMLEKIGCVVECAADGTDAIASFRESIDTENPFDCAILDLTCRGGEGGKTTFSRLRDLDSGVKGIAMSGYRNDPVMLNPERYGFSAVLAKPFTAEELGEIVQRVVGNATQLQTASRDSSPSS